MTRQEEFFIRFNSSFFVNRCAPGNGMTYIVRTGTSPEYKSRFIPDNEHWDTVNELMDQSLKSDVDLLWDRYKNNTYHINDDADY